MIRDFIKYYIVFLFLCTPQTFLQTIPLRSENYKIYWLGEEFNSILTHCIHTK